MIPSNEAARVRESASAGDPTAAEFRACWGPGQRHLSWLTWSVEALVLVTCGGTLFERSSTAGWISPASTRWGQTQLMWLLGIGILLVGLSAAVPAWLCSDLLSTRTPDNPDRHREPHPRRVMACAAGRLAEVLPAVLLWAATWSLLAVAARGGPLLPGPALGLEALFSACLLLSAFLAPGILAASLAALFSAAARRPRRGVVTFGAVFIALSSGYVVLASGSWLRSAPDPVVAALSAWGALVLGALLAAGLTLWIAWERFRGDGGRG